MGYTENNIFNAGIKMDVFGDANANAFKTTKGEEYFVDLKTLVAEAEQFGSLRRSSGSARDSNTLHKGVLKRSVIVNLREIARTARLKADEEPDFVNEFIIPNTNLNYQKTIELAIAFAEKGTPIETGFTPYGLPAGTFAELGEDTDALEQATRQQGSSATTTVGANARLDEVLKGILDLRRKIDVIARNIFANNPQKLAEWLTASHVERAAKQRTAPKTASNENT